MDHHEHDRATPRTTGEKAGEAAGGLSGLTAGAAIGSLAGPLGAVIGAVAGAVGGWWAVHAATAAHTRPRASTLASGAVASSRSKMMASAGSALAFSSARSLAPGM